MVVCGCRGSAPHRVIVGALVHRLSVGELKDIRQARRVELTRGTLRKNHPTTARSTGHPGVVRAGPVVSRTHLNGGTLVLRDGL
jgi:hypothetical protein